MFRLTKNAKFVQKWGRGTPNGQLNMVSYNLTTQNNIENTYNSPINSLLSNAKPVHKTWDHRKQLHSENLYNLAKGEGVDIFCLQEVDDDHLMEVYQPLFTSLGYKVLYAKNRGSTRKQDNYGVAIVFDKSKIEMTKQHTVQFYKDQEFREFQGQQRSTGDSGPLGLKLKSPEVALLANLQYKGHQDKKIHCCEYSVDSKLSQGRCQASASVDSHAQRSEFVDGYKNTGSNGWRFWRV